MKKLGFLYGKTRDGLLIVKTIIKNPVKVVGAIVYDRDMNRIGAVVDVFGKVDEPYLVVKPENPELIEELEVDSPLYYFIPRRKERRGGRGRRRIKRSK